MRRSYKILIGAAVAVVVILGSLLVVSHVNKPPTQPTGLEKGSASGEIGIQGTEKLNELLLPSQLAAVKTALSSYITTKIASSVVSATIAPGSTIVKPDNSITFSVNVTQPSQTFSVVLTKPSAFKIIFFVPETNYSQTLVPYQ